MAAIKKMKVKSSETFNKRSTTEKIVYGIVFGLFTLYALLMAYPMVFLFLKSMQHINDWNGVNYGDIPPTFYFESGLTLKNYLTAFTEMKVETSSGYVYLHQMFFNSIWYTGIRIVLSTLMCAITGYNLSKYKFPGSNLLYTIAIFTMTIPIVGTTGSLYKFASDVGIYNTPLFVILTSLGGFGFNFLVMYGFFKNMSWSYAEAVFLDGGGHFTAFFKVMLPQARASMVTLMILAFIANWNDYMTSLMFLPSYPTLASGLYLLEGKTNEFGIPVYYAGLVIMVIPVLVLFSAFSDVIMGNLSVGGLKG